jgi:hypothetical protein
MGWFRAFFQRFWTLFRTKPQVRDTEHVSVAKTSPSAALLALKDLRTNHPDVDAELTMLANRAWTRRGIHGGHLELDHIDLPAKPSVADLTRAADQLYAHARTRCPNLLIPMATAELHICPLDAAGLFGVDEGGYTHVSVSSAFATSPPTALAVLCHELCHHILDINGLANRHDRVNYERRTDITMFICGFGALWARGRVFIQAKDDAYSVKHLGYMTVDEYRHAREWAQDAWAANASEPKIGPGPGASFVLQTTLGLLEQQARNAIPNDLSRRRVLRLLSRQHPNKSEEWVLQKLLNDRARGR